MNLIEKLGGYEKALDLFKGCPWDSGIVDVPNPRSKGMLRLDLSELKSELLEYRRQHNIFEVGDYFVNYADDAIYTALSIDQNNHMHGKSGDKNVWTYFGRFGLRHATDEEIEAGYRLPD
jgi:hypothetical protein